jgi:hypothetical protein
MKPSKETSELVAMSVHRETLYTAKSLFNTVHSFQALFDRYLGKPGSMGASAAMAVDSGISRPMGLVDALTRIEGLKVEVAELTESVATLKAQQIVDQEKHEQQAQTMNQQLKTKAIEFEAAKLLLAKEHQDKIVTVRRELRDIRTQGIDKMLVFCSKKTDPFLAHSAFNAWREAVATQKLLHQEKSKILTELGDVGLKLLKAENKNVQLRGKYSETRVNLMRSVDSESRSALLRYVFVFWRGTTASSKLQEQLTQEQTDHSQEVARITGELSELKRDFITSRQDFRRATQSLDRVQEEQMALMKELEIWRAQGESSKGDKVHYEQQIEKLTLENIEARAKLAEALESLTAAESADSDLGVLFRKYRELEKEYRTVKKVLYPLGPSTTASAGFYQCSTCKSHVMHRTAVSLDSTNDMSPVSNADSSLTSLPPLSSPGRKSPHRTASGWR